MFGRERNLLSSLLDAAVEPRALRDVLTTAVEDLGPLLGASRAIALLSPQAAAGGRAPAPIEWCAGDPEPEYDLVAIQLAEILQRLAAEAGGMLVIDDIAEDARLSNLRGSLELLRVGRVLAVSARSRGSVQGTLILYREPQQAVWEPWQISLLEEVGYFLGAALRQSQQGTASIREMGVEDDAKSVRARSNTSDLPVENQRYRRLVENSDAIIFTTDANHVISFVSRRAVDFFGIVPEDFLGATKVHWFDLLHLEDRERVRRVAMEMETRLQPFDEEFRVINHVTGRVRWLLTKLVPVRLGEGELVGWDGFGIDITARREAQEALDIQSKKVRALYTVSTAIRGYLDPANIASRGLAALCDATGADAGCCYLYPSQRSKQLQLVAHHGFSASFADRVDASSTLSSLLQYVADQGQSIVVPDVRTDPRANRVLADEEGVRSAVLVPITVEDEMFGTLGLFNREVARFDGGDVMLVGAAANQIGLAARQANLFAAYKKQTKNLSALYRLSHELSRSLTLEETFQQAFTIIRDELGLKRLWLGLLNEHGTHIIGQAAFGPGWKKRLVEINVDISGREHPIADAVRKKRASVIYEPGKMLAEFGLKRFFSRFAIKTLGVVPLVTSGQVLGVLAVQPGVQDPVLDEEELNLLSSLANEIATIILTKRLEERVGEGDRMRSAGLLAAGIAHNFNNLLQAVMGQASLLEMQAGNEVQVQRAAKIISESATKGATLVRQLLSFANLEEPQHLRCNVNEMISKEAKALSRLLRDNQRLRILLKKGLPPALVDPRHVMRIVSSLVTNATEAMNSKGGPIQIFTDKVTVHLESPHVEVPYGEYISIGVRDSGIGMDAETKRRCFEPFFTTKDVDPTTGLGLTGAGLGLAAAYALARKNGGRLVVDSRPGYGSLFTLYVPVLPRVGESEELPSTRRDSLATSDVPATDGDVDIIELEPYSETANREKRRVAVPSGGARRLLE